MDRGPLERPVAMETRRASSHRFYPRAGTKMLGPAPDRRGADYAAMTPVLQKLPNYAGRHGGARNAGRCQRSGAATEDGGTADLCPGPQTADRPAAEPGRIGRGRGH